jgi:hypothetical protein
LENQKTEEVKVIENGEKMPYEDLREFISDLEKTES